MLLANRPRERYIFEVVQGNKYLNKIAGTFLKSLALQLSSINLNQFRIISFDHPMAEDIINLKITTSRQDNIPQHFAQHHMQLSKNVFTYSTAIQLMSNRRVPT